MKKLTAILIALGASAGLAFGKIVYEDKLVLAGAAQPSSDLFTQTSSSSNATEQFANDSVVLQLNQQVALQLSKITHELDQKIATKMNPHVL